MSKPHKRTLLEACKEAGDLVLVGETMTGYQFLDASDCLYFFSEPHFLAFTTREGLNYKCDGCGGVWHLLFWHERDCRLAPEMPGPRHAPGRIRALWEELRAKM